MVDMFNKLVDWVKTNPIAAVAVAVGAYLVWTKCFRRY